MTDMAIESVLKEERTFDPPAELSQSAAIGSMASYRQLVEEAEANPELFWGSHAKQELHWFSPFSQVLDWTNPPFARWFEGGTTNISYNCLDRHLQAPGLINKRLFGKGNQAIAAFLPTGNSTMRFVKLQMPLKPLVLSGAI